MSEGSASQPWGALLISLQQHAGASTGMGIRALLIHQVSQITLALFIVHAHQLGHKHAILECIMSLICCLNDALTWCCQHLTLPLTDRQGWMSIMSCLRDMRTNMHMSRGSKLTAHHTCMISSAQPYAYAGLHASPWCMMLQ